MPGPALNGHGAARGHSRPLESHHFEHLISCVSGHGFSRAENAPVMRLYCFLHN